MSDGYCPDCGADPRGSGGCKPWCPRANGGQSAEQTLHEEIASLEARIEELEGIVETLQAALRRAGLIEPE